jgi:hypothetical protein
MLASHHLRMCQQFREVQSVRALVGVDHLILHVNSASGPRRFRQRPPPGGDPSRCDVVGKSTLNGLVSLWQQYSYIFNVLLRATGASKFCHTIG